MEPILSREASTSNGAGSPNGGEFVNKITKPKKGSKEKPEILHVWDHTCNLPQTSFNKGANARSKETELLERWSKDDVYLQSTEMNHESKEKFILHDGPPFANGHIHIGHAYNKITKDIICKVKRMSGTKVSLIPGWDCHGLPIELKVAKENQFNRLETIKECRKYASHWIDIQKQEFIKLGILAEWNNPYITMSPSYEANTLNCLATFVEKGLVERKLKTTPWCPSCKTVLAVAEIEYVDVEDASCYVSFDVESSGVLQEFSHLTISFLVWTTAPWSIPMNRALVLRPNCSYSVVMDKSNPNRAFIVGTSRVAELSALLGILGESLKTFDSSLLCSLRVLNPLDESSIVPVILDEGVSQGEGTSVLHLAPGCGLKDYNVGMENNLEVFSPITDDGRYDDSIKELAGMTLKEGEAIILQRLQEMKHLWHLSSINHFGPSCWRCSNVIIYRATLQWFCNLRGITDQALKAAESIQFNPKQSKSSFVNILKTRDDWCLSRQRAWGVPIPAISCKLCNNCMLLPNFIREVAQRVDVSGIEFWSRMHGLQDLIAEHLIEDGFMCSVCSNQQSEHFQLERDSLDVWFVSGISHTMFLGEGIDLYFEGRDQHRGWFSSSLLTSTVLKSSTCCNTFMTHGFVLNPQGEKLSKSKPMSYITSLFPEDLQSGGMEYKSADVLRLWTAMSALGPDIPLSEAVMTNVRREYMKLRKTFRTLLGHLFDFNSEKDLIDVEKLLLMDQFALQTLFSTYTKALKCYHSNDFPTAIKIIVNYFKQDLRCGYLESGKSRLYFEPCNSFGRRSAQTCIFIILNTMVRLVAPVLSFLAEEVFDAFKKPDTPSIHLQHFKSPPNVWQELFKNGDTKTLTAQKHKQNSLLEKIKIQASKEIAKNYLGHTGNCLPAKIIILLSSDGDALKTLLSMMDKRNVETFIEEYLSVSTVSLEVLDDLKENYVVQAVKPDGTECARCWRWREVLPNGLCFKCDAEVLQR